MNDIKFKRSKYQKQICTCSTLFCAFLCPYFARLQRMEELSHVLTKNFVSCVHVWLYYFFIAAHFHFSGLSLLQLTFVIFSPPLRNFHVFFQRISSPLFSITRSRPFSVIHVSVNIKNNDSVGTDSTLLLFFLSKRAAIRFPSQ